jgi:transposase
MTLDPLDRWLRVFARRQPGCRALIAGHYGVGEIIAPTLLAELGDVRRFANGDAVVRHTGLDVTVYSLDGKRSPGHLAKQGLQLLRWALFEAAQLAARPSAADYDYYQRVKPATTVTARRCRSPANSSAVRGTRWSPWA